MLGVVVQIDGWDPVAGAPVTIRAASHDDSRVCHLNGATWWPTIAKLPTLRYDLFDGSFAGAIEAPSSSLSMAIEPWTDFARYQLADARFRMLTGTIGDGWGEWMLRFDGRVSAQPAIASGRADIAFAADDRWLDTPLLATYAGTGGAEGPASLKGQVKPLAIGAPRYVAGTLIDATNSIFQISNGQVRGIPVALERLARFGGAIADYGDHAGLLAAPIPAGRWGTALAAGMARLGAPPTGQVSFLVQGDNGGPDEWVQLPGRIIARLASLSGGAGRIDAASLAALDAARHYPLSINLTAQATGRDVIQRLAAGVNAVAGVSWLGRLFVAPVAICAPTLTLAADGSALPPVASVAQIAMAAPWSRLAMGAERTETVHPLSDVAYYGTLVDLGAYADGTTYREGNIVSREGSTWLYINPAATAGNPPPSLPTESNAWWRVLAKAGAQGNTGATLYTWIAYANAADGSVDFTTGDAGGRKYIGIASNQATAAEGTDPAAYSWTVLRGNDGAPGLTGNPGRDAVVFHQDSEPPSPVDGDTWITRTGTPIRFYKREGGGWVQLLGDVAGLSLIGRAYIGDAAIGSAQIGDAEVQTLKIAGNAVTRRAGLQIPSPISGTGSAITVLSYTLILPYAGDVIVQATGSNNYMTTVPLVAVTLAIDGGQVAGTSVGTGVFLPSFALSGIRSLAAGTHVVDVAWRGGSSDVSLTAAGLVVDAAMR